MRGKFWSDDDNAYITANYRRKGGPACAAALGRSLDSVRYQACVLGASKPHKRVVRKHQPVKVDARPAIIGRPTSAVIDTGYIAPSKAQLMGRRA
jgi:hypothetical protein